MEQAVPDLVREHAQQTQTSPPALRQRLAPLVNAINERSHSAYTYADKQLHAHPWRSAGAVFGLGVVLGALVALAARRH
jgi:ElaB/YqjD/DUF883 family membrane-anchored ribosome-binding protein